MDDSQSKKEGGVDLADAKRREEEEGCWLMGSKQEVGALFRLMRTREKGEGEILES